MFDQRLRNSEANSTGSARYNCDRLLRVVHTVFVLMAIFSKENQARLRSALNGNRILLLINACSFLALKNRNQKKDLQD